MTGPGADGTSGQLPSAGHSLWAGPASLGKHRGRGQGRETSSLSTVYQGASFSPHARLHLIRRQPGGWGMKVTSGTSFGPSIWDSRANSLSSPPKEGRGARREEARRDGREGGREAGALA